MVGLATLAIGVVTGCLEWRRHRARVEALGVLFASDERGLDFGRDLRPQAAQALALSPGLDEAEAVLAYEAARRGELDAAREHLQLASAGGEWSRRARAWLAFRGGAPQEACELLAPTPFDEDRDWIAFTSSCAPISSSSRLARTSQDFLGDVATVHAWFSDAVARGEGQDVAQLARRVLARIETVELHDERALALLQDMSARVEPFDRSVAATARAEIAAIRSGSDLGVEPWVSSTDGFRLGDALALLDDSLQKRALRRASLELEVHRLFAREDCLERATERLRRALALPVASRSSLLRAALARALARSPGSDAARKAPLSDRLGRDDPVTALALRSTEALEGALGDGTLEAFGFVLDDSPAVLAQKLQRAGLSGDDAQKLAGAVESTRAELKKSGFLDE